MQDAKISYFNFCPCWDLDLSENPHAGLEVFPCQSPVLLNAKKVNLKH